MEEDVVRRVRHELSLADSADASRCSPAPGIQALNKAGLGENLTAIWPFLVSDRLQSKARNGARIRAARVCAGHNSAGRYCPHLAAIEGTLPGRAAEG